MIQYDSPDWDLLDTCRTCYAALVAGRCPICAPLTTAELLRGFNVPADAGVRTFFGEETDEDC